MKKGFTLAEVLITLGIIGVVAALTLPNMIKNHQKRVMVAQLQRTYNAIVNAMPSYLDEVHDYPAVVIPFDNESAIFSFENKTFFNASANPSGVFLPKFLTYN